MTVSSIKLKYLLVFIGSLTIVKGNAQSSYEQLQAAYLYNFAKYIKWPNDAPTFVIGILGEAEILDDLQKALTGKKIAGKEIEIVVADKIEDALNCSIVYVSESASKSIELLCNQVMGKSILIVTENDLIKKGAMISFVVRDEHLAFKLKSDALLKSGLKASEGLLKLAIVQ